jgi:hypothetical protein
MKVEIVMHKTILIAASLAAASSLGGCANHEMTRDTLRGTAIGGAGGAVAGALIPGLGVGTGAAIGAAGGAAVGAATSEGNRHWHRDSRGHEYYIDRDGNRVYR